MSMRRASLVIGVLVVLAGGRTAFGCMCIPTPMCSSLSYKDAAFVGRVIEVWPARQMIADEQKLSIEALHSLILQR